MSEKIDLEIVTPKGRALTAQVDEVTAPSVNGEFGVMPGHIPLLAALRTGIVTYRAGGDTKSCAVGSGTAEAGPDKLLLLVDAFVEKDNVDPVLCHKELSEAQADYDKLAAKDSVAGAEVDKRRVLVEKINWLCTQLELYGEAPLATIRLLEDLGVRDNQDEAHSEEANQDAPKPDDAS
ncbi:MAG: ATP synthase F1 subunit epsilon [Polyangiaceae bacterium]